MANARADEIRAEFEHARQAWDGAHLDGGQLLGSLLGCAAALPDADAIRQRASAGAAVGEAPSRSSLDQDEADEQAAVDCERLLQQMRSVVAELCASQTCMASAAQRFAVSDVPGGVLEAAGVGESTPATMWAQTPAELHAGAIELLAEQCTCRETETQLKSVILASLLGELGAVPDTRAADNSQGAPERPDAQGNPTGNLSLPPATVLQNYLLAWNQLPYCDFTIIDGR
jgi:hypothetical protein